VTLQEVQIECDLALQKLEKCFKPGIQLTLIARAPFLDDGDLILTRDNLDDVIKSIERLKTKEAGGLPVGSVV
jgi:hypothetical protein